MLWGKFHLIFVQYRLCTFCIFVCVVATAQKLCDGTRRSGRESQLLPVHCSNTKSLGENAHYKVWKCLVKVTCVPVISQLRLFDWNQRNMEAIWEMSLCQLESTTISQIHVIFVLFLPLCVPQSFWSIQQGHESIRNSGHSVPVWAEQLTWERWPGTFFSRYLQSRCEKV